MSEVEQEEDIFQVFYVGKDSHYYERIQKKIAEDYPDKKVKFLSSQMGDKKTAKDIFSEIYDVFPEIVYIDFTTDTEMCFPLTKWLTRNNEMRKLSVVALISETSSKDFLRRVMNTPVRMIHYKNIEINDVVFSPLSLIDVNTAKMPELFRGKTLKDIEILLPIRISYIEDNHFHIETNSYLNIGDIVEVDHHPLMHIMPSKKLYTAKFSDTDLYFNKRFSYDLEFIYIDNDFFTISNENWKLFKKLKENPEFEKNLNEHDRDEILSDMEIRRRKYGPIREKIDEWLESHQNRSVPKRLKLLIFDAAMTIFRAREEWNMIFPYTTNVQTKIMRDAFQIKRFSPHLIVCHYDEEKNNKQRLKFAVDALKNEKRDLPPLIVFNYSRGEKDLKEFLDYPKLLVYKNNLSLGEIYTFAQKLDQKMHITDAATKVYPTSKDEDSQLLIKRRVDFISMTESYIFFNSKIEIPMWTTFKVENPVPMLLTVVPRREDERENTEEGTYYALVHGIKEKDRARLRQVITQTLMEKPEDTASD